MDKLAHNIDDDLPVKMEPQIKVCYFQFPFLVIITIILEQFSEVIPFEF